MTSRNLWAALGLAAALAWPVAGHAADPILGTTKYSQNCSGCHSVASTAAIDRGRNSPSMIRSAINNVGAMSHLSSLSTADLEDIAAYLGNAPSSLSFAQTTVGQTSATQTVTVRASRTAVLSNLAASVSGDFARSGGTCGSSLVAGGSCTITAAFTPTAAGSRSGTLSISHSGLTTAVPIKLSGTGVAAAAPTISLDASSLAFGNQTVNTSSSAKTLTVSNTGSAALNFSAITLGGNAAADYSATGGCAVGTAVAAGGSCTLSLRFTPSATGSRSATLTLASDASNGNATVSLSGTGQATATPQASLAPASLAFGSVTVGTSSTARTVTLTNSGGAALSISAISAASPFSATHACGNTLAAGASCAINVVFTPGGAGAASGSLSVTSNASGSPHSVGLTGTGVLATSGDLQWTDGSAVDFGSTTVGDDATTHTLTLSNSGNGTATLVDFTLGGSHAADFRVDGSSSCSAGQSLAAGAQCTVVLGFSPAATGARSASLAVSASNASTPDAVALAGTGVAPAAPALSLSTESLAFVAPASGTAAAQTLTLTNTGTGDLHLSALTLSGGTRFSVSGTGAGGCGAAPVAMPAGASCTLAISWAGTVADANETATLTVTGDMPAGSATVSLSGQGGADEPSNQGGGGCTLGAGTGAADPLLILMAALAGFLAWRRRRSL
ncbi:MAG TPA: choice-of-anchor D domain-containing protein [Ideonella sp.]|uniref:choice-of-anchor D domain-containing protein n=1 Tax=Ideonella sp. TaxID=1929293 RepID=UPI002E33509E|nr:choice-of-anchor D domain-containing protein [Ideonella sp.]HEX5683180.1 choice-of-anchor D domain-containing protein [Ideonella sp.]